MKNQLANFSSCCEAKLTNSFDTFGCCPDCGEPCGAVAISDIDQVNSLIANEREYVPSEPYAQPGAWPTLGEVATFALIVIALGVVAIGGRVLL